MVRIFQTNTPPGSGARAILTELETRRRGKETGAEMVTTGGLGAARAYWSGEVRGEGLVLDLGLEKR